VGVLRPTVKNAPATRGLESVAAEVITLEATSARALQRLVAERVLHLFGWSLLGTLAFAACLVVVDAIFLAFKIIRPEDRLMSERIVMTFIGSTVVQVGTAFAAIVVAVFKAKDD